MKKSLASLALLAIILSACSGAAVGTTQPDGEGVDTPIEQPTEAAESTVEPDTTLPPEGGTKTIQPGEAITVTNDGEDWARISVDDVDTKKSYGEYDKPEVKGNVFLSAKVKYEALVDGVDYNPFDWAVFVDGKAIDNFAFASEGPKPELSSGTLPKGRTAEGYVLYEVPADGEVLMSYQGNMFSDQPPLFEVVLRK